MLSEIERWVSNDKKCTVMCIDFCVANVAEPEPPGDALFCWLWFQLVPLSSTHTKFKKIEFEIQYFSILNIINNRIGNLHYTFDAYDFLTFFFFSCMLGIGIEAFVIFFLRSRSRNSIEIMRFNNAVSVEFMCLMLEYMCLTLECMCLTLEYMCLTRSTFA
jgi:hypothetical protein